MSKQRNFSHKDQLDYIDYLKLKTGEITLKNLKTKSTHPNLRFFINYQEFLNLTKAYYKYKNTDLCSFQPLVNIYNTNVSFTAYKKTLEHINSCNCCSSNSNNVSVNCSELANLLYPYGIYITHCPQNIYFPNRIDLTQWCNKKKAICELDHHYIDTNIQNDFNTNKQKENEDKEINNPNNPTNPINPTNSSNKKKLCGGKYGLCKNTRSLYI
jgi:hypothetical protein